MIKLIIGMQENVAIMFFLANSNSYDVLNIKIYTV